MAGLRRRSSASLGNLLGNIMHLTPIGMPRCQAHCISCHSITKASLDQSFVVGSPPSVFQKRTRFHGNTRPDCLDCQHVELAGGHLASSRALGACPLAKRIPRGVLEHAQKLT